MEKRKKPNTWQDSNPQPLCYMGCGLPLCHNYCPIIILTHQVALEHVKTKQHVHRLLLQNRKGALKSRKKSRSKKNLIKARRSWHTCHFRHSKVHGFNTSTSIILFVRAHSEKLFNTMHIDLEKSVSSQWMKMLHIFRTLSLVHRWMFERFYVSSYITR